VRGRYPDPDHAATDGDYAGSLECKECHEDRWDSLGTSFHATLRAQKKGTHRGCESCHGPGFLHFEAGGEGLIRHPGKVTQRVSNGACITCHADVLTEPKFGHRAWVEGADAQRGAARCVDCHLVHLDRTAAAHRRDGVRARRVEDLAEIAEPVPAATCIACHPRFHPEMRRSGHADLATGTPACAACHGNGSLHVASGGRAAFIVDPEEQPAKLLDRSCNSCHSSGESMQRWTCAEHGREGVSCIVCHDANAPRGKTLRAPEYQLCGSCHQDVTASFRLPNGHDVADGKQTCSSCHDPHGNTSRVRDLDVRLKACTNCHQEKRGPFFHDHGIKRTEGCTACHLPHGSANRRLLTHTRTRELCLQCHSEVPRSHDLRSARYQNCIACHSEIHGSDIDRLFRR
jgi:DmsE family decaheme c-type cytochrome